MKHIFIINPAAGVGASEKSVLPEIIKFTKEHGEDFEIHRSLNKHEICSFVKSRAASGDPIRFYAVGGDGTISDVLNGMAEYGNAELAVIPCGSGNDFARNFKNKSNFLNLEKQLFGTVEYVDIIKFNDSYCMNMINIGLDCDVNQYAGALRVLGKFKGSASYVAAALKLLPSKKTYDIEYTDEAGNVCRENLMITAIGNGMYCGGGFRSCPRASLIDGKMDVGIIRPIYNARLPKLLLKYRFGKHLEDRIAAPFIRYMQLSEFKLIPHGEMNICIDGETEKCPDLNMKVMPRAVKFVIPEGSSLIQ